MKSLLRARRTALLLALACLAFGALATSAFASGREVVNGFRSRLPLQS